MNSIYTETQEYWRSAFDDCWSLANTTAGIPTILLKRMDTDFRVLYLVLRALAIDRHLDIDNISHLRLKITDLHAIASIANISAVDIGFSNRQMILR